LRRGRMQLLRDKGISRFRSRVHVIERDGQQRCEQGFGTSNYGGQRYSRRERRRGMPDEIFASTLGRVLFLSAKAAFYINIYKVARIGGQC
jgi:hypothetical protein